MKLTRRQTECCKAIQEYQSQNGEVPTQRELADIMGVKSPSGIHRMLVAMERRGAIVRIPHATRCYKLVGMDDGHE